MTWARFDDKYSTNPKVIAAGAWAELLDMRGIIYCAQNETDGLIERSVLERIGVGIPAAKGKAKRLIEVGRWLEHADGWEIHSYLKYNPSHAKLEADRDAARSRMNKARSKGRSSEDVRPNERENIAPGSPNPVPSRPPIDSSHQGLHAAPDEPVDEEASERAERIFGRIVDGQMERANGVQNPEKYRAKVRADVLTRSIGVTRLVRIIEKHPEAPDEMLAAAAMQEPTPYLRNYAVSA